MTQTYLFKGSTGSTSQVQIRIVTMMSMESIALLHWFAHREQLAIVLPHTTMTTRKYRIPSISILGIQKWGYKALNTEVGIIKVGSCSTVGWSYPAPNRKNSHHSRSPDGRIRLNSPILTDVSFEQRPLWLRFTRALMRPVLFPYVSVSPGNVQIFWVEKTRSCKIGPVGRRDMLG